MKIITVCILLTIIVAGTALPLKAENPQKVLLEFKPLKKALELNVHRVCDIFETTWERQRHQSSYEGKNSFKYKIVQNSGGYLDVKSKLLSSTKKVNGKLLHKGKPENGKTASYTMDYTGKRVDQGAKAESSDLALRFPQKKVKEGDTWKVSLPPSEDFPRPIEMLFKLMKVMKKSGKLLAVINNKYEAGGYIEERGCRAKVKGKNRILFSITDGHIVRQSGTSEFIITWVTKGEDNPFQSSTFSKIKVSAK